MIPAHADAARASQPRRKTLALALAASFAMHVAIVAFVALPIAGDTIVEPRTLEVVIAEPPRPLPPLEKPRPAPPPQPHKREQRRSPLEARKASPREEAPQSTPKSVLALPAESPTPPAFSVPAAPPEPRATAPSEAKLGSAPGEVSGNDKAPVTPPSLNAAYLRNEPPRYPPSARRSGIEGRVNLKVLVTRDGRAAQVQVHESSGSPVLDDAAVAAVRNWRFVPARRGQEPVEESVIVPIVFKLEKSG